MVPNRFVPVVLGGRQIPADLPSLRIVFFLHAQLSPLNLTLTYFGLL